MYSFFQQKVKNAEAMALKKKTKHGEQQEALSVQLQGDPSSFLRFVSFFFFITYVSKHSLDVLWGCFCKKP